MKVLLFVQTGDARPKVLKRATKGYIKAAILDRCEAGRESWRTHNQIDRWWLVECENAERGREAIASGRAELRSGFGGNGSMLIGRIIATGGKEVKP